MFAIVDCNNFYASCERVFRPELNGKPIVILSNNDGCVIARSNEAKEHIPMGAPTFKYKEILKQKNINVFSSNYPLYGDMSNRVMALLSKFSPDIEIYSIDEAFLEFKGFENNFNLHSYCENIKKIVDKGTGIPVSIGVAPTKALSKVANRIAKKYFKRTKGVYTIDTEEKRIKALKWLKIGDVWGIGRKYAKRLEQNGIYTAYAFTQLTDSWVRKEMSVVGLRLKHELEGKPSLKLDEIKTKKMIATTRSFDKMYSDFEIIKERVSTFAISCAEKIRAQKSTCNSLMIFIHTNGYRQELKQYNRSIVVKLPYATNSSIELSKFAMQGLEKIFRKGYRYKKAGVIAMDLRPEDTKQLFLFENSDARHKKLMNIMDKFNNKLGTHKIKLGSQSTGKMWKMKQEKLSPRYTTSLKEIITIKV